MTTPADLLRAAQRAREGQQAAAIAYQRAVGRVLAVCSYGPAAAIAALEAAGLKPSRGTQWTPHAVQGVRVRIRERAAADPEFAAEVRSWRPPTPPRPPPGPSIEQAQEAARHRQAAIRAAEDAAWAAAAATARAADEAARRGRQAVAERERQERVAAREEAVRVARAARRAGKSAEAVAEDIRRTTLGTAAAREIAAAYRERVWPVVAPLLAKRMSLAQVAAELNRQGVPRLQSRAGWTRLAVLRIGKAQGGRQGP